MKGNFVGVVSPLAFETLWYPKRLMLMFDQLALDLNHDLTGYESYVLKQSNAEINWLSDQSLLTTLSGLVVDHKSKDSNLKGINSEYGFLLPGSIQNQFNKFLNSPSSPEASLRGLRYTASELRRLNGIDAVALSTPEYQENIDNTTKRPTVIKITLEQFPMPSDSVPWENIIDFKANTESKAQFQRLKVWMNKISKSGLTECELKDELQEMLFSYEEGLKHAKIKLQKGVFEVMLTTSAEIIENLVRIKPSQAIKSIFQIKEQSIKLYEEEKAIIGREIAYIISANRKFK